MTDIRILARNNVKELTSKLFTNYDLAYVGNHFSKSFTEWIKLFCEDVKMITTAKGSHYIGRVATIKYRHFLLRNTSVVYIQSISFNPRILLHTAAESHFERISKGLPSTPPSLISSTKSVTDYMYYSEGGTYNGHVIDIVKKKGSSKTKPQFNYYDRNTRSIMFNFDFYSPFEFVNNEAEAWATDGHKYKLPSMIFLEAKNKDGLHSKTKRLIRLTEDDLCHIVKNCINEVLVTENKGSLHNI